MLVDTVAFDDWIGRDDPSYRVARPVEAWITGLDRESWQAPSVPIEDLSKRPVYEFRQAVIGTVTIDYVVTFGEPDRVELFDIRAADRPL